MLQFVHGVAAQLGEAGDRPEAALQLFLAGAQSASEVARLELIAYEFFEQARGSGAPVAGPAAGADVLTAEAAGWVLFGRGLCTQSFVHTRADPGRPMLMQLGPRPARPVLTL